MSARKVSREPYRIGRDRREIWVAVAAALAIVLVTALAVWILAPSGDGSDAPSLDSVITVPPDVTASTAVEGTPGDSTATSVPAEDTTATTGG